MPASAAADFRCQSPLPVFLYLQLAMATRCLSNAGVNGIAPSGALSRVASSGRTCARLASPGTTRTRGWRRRRTWSIGSGNRQQRSPSGKRCQARDSTARRHIAIMGRLRLRVRRCAPPRVAKSLLCRHCESTHPSRYPPEASSRAASGWVDAPRGNCSAASSRLPSIA